ncbi:MAG: hypothetical protein HDS78_08635 [Bacteroidales bacterium]|nr:hypothetical protein [Bacteroidales bacterium]
MNTSNRQQESSPMDALAEMAAECSSTSSEVSQAPESALEEMTTDSVLANEAPETDVAAVQYSVDTQLRMLREIDRMMGQFFDSLKSVKSEFTQRADSYFEQANVLADKKNPTDNELAEAVANIVIGGAIKGIGNIWQAFKTQQQLSQVKAIIANEANQKLDYLRSLYDTNQKLWEVTFDRYCQSDNFADDQINFNQFRLQDYIVSVNIYLIDVYQESLCGNFTNLAFPSFYNTNKRILYKIFTNPGETSSDEATIKEHRRVIKELVNGVIDSIVSNRIPCNNEFILASDSQMMAVAINEYLDLNFRESFSGFTSENHPVYPDKLQSIDLFDSLYGEAYNHPESSLSDYVRDNESLQNSLLHYYQVATVESEYEQRNVLYNINALLVSVVCFLGSMVHFDLAWYWGLVVGVVAWFVAAKCTPFTSWEELCKEKTICIQRKIALDNLNKAGYVEMINFSELAANNNSVWLFVVLGAIVGLIVPIPFGWLIGAILGGALGGSSSEEIPSDFDYTAINLGSTWKAQAVSAIFTALAVYYLYVIIF